MDRSASANVTNALDDLWSRVDAYLRSRLRPDPYERWFAPLRPTGLEGGRLQVAAPDRFHRDFVEDNYRSFFEEFLPTVAGEPLRITFVVDESPRPQQQQRPALTPVPALSAVSPAPAPPSPDPRDARPNPRYTFDTFVVGESNRFAFAATQAVSTNPGKSWNPLF
ncbi:MAG TPA: DnaA N-terminal domain-containing protein, partial [Anaeromyxobacter sp.]|nr:DnaA N-terminal domain-containing protein [Anaeromyxobacter sp.]